MLSTHSAPCGSLFGGRGIGLASGLLVAALVGPIAFAPASVGAAAITPVMTCADLTSLSLANTQIISAAEVTSASGNYCNVIGLIDKRVSTQDPDNFTYGIGFELNLPDSWVGRFEMQGGSGTDGSVKSPQGSASTELSQGWAVAADDGGHEDAPGNPAFDWTDDDSNAGGTAHFGIDEQARVDYGYKGIEQTTAISKQIIAQYYGQGPQYSYLWGGVPRT